MPNTTAFIEIKTEQSPQKYNHIFYKKYTMVIFVLFNIDLNYTHLLIYSSYKNKFNIY